MMKNNKQDSSLETTNKEILSLNQNNGNQRTVILSGNALNISKVKVLNPLSTTRKTSTPVKYVFTNNRYVQQNIKKPIEIPRERIEAHINERRDINSAISSLRKAANLGKQITIQHIQNGKMSGEILNNVLLGNDATIATGPIKSINAAKSTSSMILNSASISSPIQITTTTNSFPATPIKPSIIDAPMSQAQIRMQQPPPLIPILQPKPIIIKNLQTSNINNLPSLANCTVITTIPIAVESKEDPLSLNDVNSLKNVGSLSAEKEMEVEIPMSLPPDLDLFLTDSNNVKVLPKPEDIIPETTISSSGVLPINLQTNFVKVNDQHHSSKVQMKLNNGSIKNSSMIITNNSNNSNNSNGIINRNHFDEKNIVNKTNHNSTISKNNNSCQVKVVNKTETSCAITKPLIKSKNSQISSSVANSTGGGLSNKKPPIILNVMSSPGPKSKNPTSINSDNVSTLNGIITPEKISEILKNSNNKRPSSSLKNSKIIEFGSPRKRAKSLQTDSIEQQLKQPSSSSLHTSGITIERRHSSGAELLIQPIALTKAKANNYLNTSSINLSEIDHENESSRTVDSSLDEYDQSSQDNLTSSQESKNSNNNNTSIEIDHISLVSDDIEMVVEDYIQSSASEQNSNNTDQMGNDDMIQEDDEDDVIEEIHPIVENMNDEPETILPDVALPINIIKCHELNIIEMQPPSDNDSSSNKELSQASSFGNSSNDLTFSQEINEEEFNLDNITILANNQVQQNSNTTAAATANDVEDDDSNDLIIVETPTDQIEIPDDDDEIRKDYNFQDEFSKNLAILAKPNQKMSQKSNIKKEISLSPTISTTAATAITKTSSKNPKLNKNFNLIKSSLTPTRMSNNNHNTNKVPTTASIRSHSLQNANDSLGQSNTNYTNNITNSASDATCFSSMLEMISNLNMLQWKERIGKASGTNIVFELNEYNLLQVYERCPTRNNLHTAYEKPIYERIILNKDEKLDNVLYLCKRCNCHGSAIDFLAPNFCSLQCLNRDNKKRKRSALGNPSSNIHINGNQIIKSKNQKFMEKQQQEQPSSSASPLSDLQAIKPKKRFRWSKLLNEKLDGSSAPISLFLNPFPIGNNPFAIGMKLEAIDPDNCSIFCICTVVQIKGYRIKLHFDGYDKMYDFWVNADSMDIFPLGWCSKTGRVLQPPRNYDAASFNLKKYVEFSKAFVASKSLFTHLKSTSSDIVNPFKIGMHLEAEDLNDTGKLCVATVADLINDRIRIHFDGWDDCYDYWVHISSPYIHPCGWHEGRQQLIVPPDYENLPFVWDDYIKTIGKGSPATAELFCIRDPIDFQPNMKLEVVDPRNPSLIRPASIVQRKGHRVKIHLEFWAPEYCFWIEDDSPDLHPVGWCYQTNHEIEPPPGFEQKTIRLKCQINGCRGLGNAKNFSENYHSNLDECPYSIENWKNQLDKNPRIQSSEIIRAPEELAPFIEIKKENIPLLSNPVAVMLNKKSLNEKPAQMTTQIKYKKIKQNDEEIISTTESIVKPSLIKEELIKTPETQFGKELVRNPLNKICNQESIATSITSTVLIPELKEDVVNDKCLAKKVSSKVASVDLPLEMKVAREFLCDYGPRLQQNFNLLEKNFTFKVENVTDNPMLWNSTKTANYIESILNSKTIANSFLKADIDGVALLMLQQNDLTDIMGLKIGPAAKLCFTILQLRILYIKQYNQSSIPDYVSKSQSNSKET